MKSRFDKHQFACVILLATVLLTLIFIFGNSLVSREQSQGISDKVNESVGAVIESVTGKEDSSFENFFTKYHRKIAHFIEFAALGAQIALLLHVAKKRRFSPLLSGALASFLFASVDEGIQMFTERGDAVKDIFIDAFGYMSAYFLVILILYFFSWRRRANT